MFSQLAKRSARILPADLCNDHAHYLKNHRSTVLGKTKTAVEGGTVSHYYILVIRKFIDLFHYCFYYILTIFQLPVKLRASDVRWWYSSYIREQQYSQYSDKFKLRLRKCSQLAKGLVKKYRGGDGPEHLEMWLIKNTWPTPSLRHKDDWPTPKARLELTWPTP